VYDWSPGQIPGAGNTTLSWFLDAWKKTGKKLDMGKCCIRFRKLEDLPLEIIGEAIRRVSAKDFVRFYEASRAASASANAAGKAGKQFAPGKMGSGKAQAFANPAKSAPTRVKAAKKHG
jgi:hypothetical protein